MVPTLALLEVLDGGGGAFVDAGAAGEVTLCPVGIRQVASPMPGTRRCRGSGRPTGVGVGDNDLALGEAREIDRTVDDTASWSPGIAGELAGRSATVNAWPALLTADGHRSAMSEALTWLTLNAGVRKVIFELPDRRTLRDPSTRANRPEPFDIRLVIYRPCLISPGVSLRHAVLGFLSLRPLTGYDVKKYFDASIRHFWSADQAQIYRSLSQMADEGLVEVHVIAQDSRPDRKEHHITAAGLAELDSWLCSPLEPQAVREPFLVKVFFAGRLPSSDAATMLDARVAAAGRQLDILRQVAAQTTAALEQGPPALEGLLATATLENGIRHVVAELQWLHDLRADLEDVPAGAQRMRQRLSSIVQPDQPGPAPHQGDRR